MLTGAQALRYEKHIDLPNFGETQQEKLLSARVAIVGAGGLGCPTALYLSASGVGHIKLIDDDTVSMTNLARQILYTREELNQSKVNIAKKTLSKINPDCTIEPIFERLKDDNTYQHLQDSDVIIDATDNFKTRYLLNKAAIELKKPLVSGSVVYYTGQVMVFHPTQAPDNPCYNCLYPVQPENKDVPACLDSGVLSPITGTVGSLMATEVIKQITNIGAVNYKEMIIYGALHNSFDRIKIRKLESCSSCQKID